MFALTFKKNRQEIHVFDCLENQRTSASGNLYRRKVQIHAHAANFLPGFRIIGSHFASSYSGAAGKSGHVMLDKNQINHIFQQLCFWNSLHPFLLTMLFTRAVISSS